MIYVMFQFERGPSNTVPRSQCWRAQDANTDTLPLRGYLRVAQTIAPLKFSLINFINARLLNFCEAISGLHVPTYGIYILLKTFNFSLMVIKGMQTK